MEEAVVQVKDGQEAVELVENENQVDLIFMDLKMPLMNGFEATKRIKNFNKNIPVIAQSGYINPENKMELEKAEFNDYIEKPIDMEKLVSLVHKYLYHPSA